MTGFRGVSSLGSVGAVLWLLSWWILSYSIRVRVPRAGLLADTTDASARAFAADAGVADER